MTQYTELTKLVGKTMDETQDADWLEHWPVINQAGVIQEILHNDDFDAEQEVLINWVDGKAVEVDGTHGFDAVLR